MTYHAVAADRPDRYKVSVEQYIHYQRYGYLIVQSLIDQPSVMKLLNYAEDLLYGRVDVPGLEPVKSNASMEELFSRFTRIHMLHRDQATAEWGLLLPRVLDVLEALIGPDVLALQTMLFLNPPGKGGQGWHQDAYYIPTYPDTLIGAWIALDPADEENGCLWVVPGSHHEPIYPTKGFTNTIHAEGAFDGLFEIENASHLDDNLNTLSQVAAKYPAPIPVPLKPGDVLFFHSHLLHRSYPNRTKDRFRRSFVCHYCNARSWVPWDHGRPFEGDSANYRHILARGSTHLPYAKPKFGTPVQVGSGEGSRSTAARMMGMEDGNMAPVEEIHFLEGDFSK
jgi:chlorinating enzyme